MEILVHSSKIHAPVEDVFNWHVREGAFERLNPLSVIKEMATPKGS
jgi:ligand-binding SRPBCC domain-containing protein